MQIGTAVSYLCMHEVMSLLRVISVYITYLAIMCEVTIAVGSILVDIGKKIGYLA